MKKILSVSCCIFLLFLSISPLSSDAIPISGTGAWGSFTGTITYTYHEASGDAILEVVLTNTSSAVNGGYLTAFAYNNVGGNIASVKFTDPYFELLGAPHFDNNLNGMPLGYFDIGAGLGASWQDGGEPWQGIGVGATETFTFQLSGVNLNTVDEKAFLNELSEGGGHFFAARFRGFENGESDKVPAGNPVPLTLSSFRAISHRGSIEVSWTSQTEVDVLAYHLYRGQREDGLFTPIVRLNAQGNSENPREYRYVDTDVAAGRTYYYKLANEDYGGQVEFHGPIYASVGASVPEAYNLLPNYPNPFNSTTALGYEIPVAGHVALTIYDILGREVRSLVNVYQQAGRHTILWDGRDNSERCLNSGVYFYTLKAGDFTQVRKMVLLR
jgi:hypothetical protein